MNGLFYTSPIREVIEKIKLAGGHILSPDTARIDQLEGLKRAIEIGYRRIAVTINGFAGEPLWKIREIEREANVSVFSLVVCTTGVDRKRAEEAAKHADIVWGCASKYIRELVGSKSKLQLGVRIPVFVLTRRGINFVASYFSDDVRGYIKDDERYLVTLHPTEPNKCVKIIIGELSAYMQKVDKLPVESEDAPRPLL